MNDSKVRRRLDLATHDRAELTRSLVLLRNAIEARGGSVIAVTFENMAAPWSAALVYDVPRGGDGSAL